MSDKYNRRSVDPQDIASASTDNLTAWLQDRALSQTTHERIRIELAAR